MPSRKSDVRRSDVSAVARPAGDEDSPMTIVPAPTQDEADVSVAPRVAAAADQSSSETPQVGEPNAGPTSEKGKEKEKEKEKERERERERKEDAITIEDLNLPKSIITRLAKGVLPPNTQIQANAILALSKSATVFISHLSNAANEWTMSAGKKTIMPADVFRALDDVEYGFMRERLEAEFAKFNETQSTKRSAYRKKVSAARRAVKGGLGDDSVADSSFLSTGTGGGADADESMIADTTMGTMSGDVGGGEARAAKKARVDTTAAGDGGSMDVDGEGGGGDGEVSDAETQPDEHVDEDDEDDDDEEGEEEEEDEEEEGGEGANGEDDELEERTGRDVEDEALDEDSE